MPTEVQHPHPEALEYTRALLAACEELARSRGYSLDDDEDPTGPPDGIWRPAPEILTNPHFDWRAAAARKAAESAKQSPTSDAVDGSDGSGTFAGPRRHTRETAKQSPSFDGFDGPDTPATPAPSAPPRATAKQFPTSGAFDTSDGSGTPPHGPLRWIGTTRARRLLGLGSDNTVKAWARAGHLRSRRLPNGRTQVLLEDVLRLTQP